MIWLAEYNYYKGVKALVNAGAGLNIQTISGKTALMNAADYNSIESAKILVDAGAGLNISDTYNRTALDFANGT